MPKNNDNSNSKNSKNQKNEDYLAMLDTSMSEAEAGEFIKKDIEELEEYE